MNENKKNIPVANQNEKAPMKTTKEMKAPMKNIMDKGMRTGDVTIRVTTRNV